MHDLKEGWSESAGEDSEAVVVRLVGSEGLPREGSDPEEVVGSGPLVSDPSSGEGLDEGVGTVSVNDRRAVGRTVELISHGFDFLAFLVPLTVLSSVVGVDRSLKIFLLYALLGTALLWPTMRRGRLPVPASEGLLSIIGRVCLTPVFTLMVVAVVKGLLGWGYDNFDVLWIAGIAFATVPTVLLGRLVSSKLVGVIRSRGYDLEDVIIVGTGPIGVEVAQALVDNPEFGLVPCGFVDRFDDEMPLPVLGRPENLRQILHVTGVRHVVLAFGAAEEEELVGIIRSCYDQIVQFWAIPRLFELGVAADSVGQELSGLPIVEVRRPGTAASMWPAKRAFDLITAGVLTILALPLLIVCALAVRLTSRGPVFFKQVRIGIGGRPFEILKFRTMRVNDDSSTQWCVDDDDRVTRVGRILRPSHLDELPQLINVLRGEMSLVGPRPERPHFVEQFSSEIDDYEYRHRVPVGITGWAQVNGYWGDTSIETRVRLDNRYIENWSLWRDLVIGLRTIPTLLGRRR